MNEFVMSLILGTIGFFIGGLIGTLFFAGFFPAAWIGLVIGCFAIFCPCIIEIVLD